MFRRAARERRQAACVAVRRAGRRLAVPERRSVNAPADSPGSSPPEPPWSPFEASRRFRNHQFRDAGPHTSRGPLPGPNALVPIIVAPRFLRRRAGGGALRESDRDYRHCRSPPKRPWRNSECGICIVAVRTGEEYGRCALLGRRRLRYRRPAANGVRAATVLPEERSAGPLLSRPRIQRLQHAAVVVDDPHGAAARHRRAGGRHTGVPPVRQVVPPVRGSGGPAGGLAGPHRVDRRPDDRVAGQPRRPVSSR